MCRTRFDHTKLLATQMLTVARPDTIRGGRHLFRALESAQEPACKLPQLLCEASASQPARSAQAQNHIANCESQDSVAT